MTGIAMQLHKRALEVDEALRLAYRRRCLSRFCKDQFVFIDESAVVRMLCITLEANSEIAFKHA